jgi:hypothetical protein
MSKYRSCYKREVVQKKMILKLDKLWNLHENYNLQQVTEAVFLVMCNPSVNEL